MERRDFIKKISGTAAVAVIAPNLLLAKKDPAIGDLVIGIHDKEIYAWNGTDWNRLAHAFRTVWKVAKECGVTFEELKACLEVFLTE